MLIAKPYYSEYVEGDTIVIFHGNITDENEPMVRALERKFMEEDTAYGDLIQTKWNYRQELKELGISIEFIENYGLPRPPFR